MKCARCQKDNPVTAQFCTGCGERLSSGPGGADLAAPGPLVGRQVQPTQRGSHLKLVLIGVGGVLGAAVVAFVIWASIGPIPGVKFSNEMDSYALEYIEEHGLLRPTESLVAYYDVTLSMNSTEAAILTTEAVMYHKGGRTIRIEIRDIDNVQHRTETFTGDIIEITGKSGDRIKMEIAPLNQGRSFYDALMDVWTAAGSGQR